MRKLHSLGAGSRAWPAAAAALTLTLVATLLSPATAVNADEAEDLARWDFTSGAASDVSWHGHDGVAGSGIAFSDSGASFNGTDAGEITVEHAASYQIEAAAAADTWSITVNGVVPAVVGSAHRTILGSRAADDGWALYITPERRIEFWVAQNSGTNKYAMAKSGVIAAVGSSYDIVATRKGDVISIAVTGATTGSGTATLGGGYNATEPGTPLRFGNGGNAGTEFRFSGTIGGATIGIDVAEEEPPVENPDPDPADPTDPGDEWPLEEETYEVAASDVLERAIGAAVEQVEFDMVAPTTSGEQFTISGTPGDIRIEATTPVALSTGAGWYLKYVVNAAVNLGNPEPVVPAVLPAPESPIIKTAHEGSRFALNDTNEGYTDPYLDWDGWQRLLDNLALHGVNQVFLSIGTDAVYAELLQEYGYSEAEARAWVPQPAHQPWWVLQNISSTQDPMTADLLAERAELAARVVDRAAELGITPVIPGYFGTVPTDFASRNPGANVVEQGTWSSYQRPAWLDPTSALFGEVAADFYRISSELIGDVGAYKMDPLHEGGRPGDVSVPGAAAAIETALQKAQPGALWVLLGWQSNPSTALLSGVVDKSNLLIVDGLSDTVATLNRETRWPGVPYAFGSIYNFGGNTSIGAISTVWLDRYFTARDKPGSSLTGVAILPEGFYNNPAAYELMSELPWMDAKPDHAQWFRDYAQGRYGTTDASAAWDIVSSTAYAMAPIGTHSESHDSLFAAQPSLTTTKARSCCAQGVVRYDMAKFATALPALIAAAPSVVQKAAYDYDLTDITRQVIANQSRDLLPQINAAYLARDLEKFDELTQTWMASLQQLDEVLATNVDFMLGSYVERAEAQNSGIGRYDLQNLLTTWGTRASFSLHDYANREWQGLVGDFYASRWEQYFDTLRPVIETGATPAPIDWFVVDEQWATGDHGYPTEPEGDILEEAIATVDALNTGAVVVALAAPVVRPGAVATVTATVQNTSVLGAVASVEVSLSAPDDVSVTPTSPTTLTDLGAGQSRTVTWSAAVADGASGSVVAPITATAVVNSGDEPEVETATADLLVGAELGAPWSAHSTETDTTFAAAGDQLAIRTTGADFSRGTRRLAAAYQNGLMIDGTSAVVRVDQQTSEGSRPWARTGIIVANDATSASSPLAVLALTPAHGCAMSWNSGSNGSIDRHAEVATFTAPLWLRLERVGDTFEGSCSVDGTTWTSVGTATPSGIAATADVGLFASAVNTGQSDRVLGVFSDFSLDDGSTPDGPDLQVSAATRCAAGKAQLTVTALNSESIPVRVEFESAYGTKPFTAVQPGKSAFHAFTTRLGQLEAGDVAVTATFVVDGEPVSSTEVIDYSARNCG